MRNPLELVGRALGRVTDQAPVPYVPTARAGLPMGLPGRGSMEGQMRAYGSVGTLFSIVHRLATATSQVDWHLYRKSTDQRRRYAGGDENRIEVTRHAAIDLWNRPNPFMGRQEYVESVQQHVELTGEGYNIPVFGAVKAAGPIEMWFVRPDRMLPVPHITRFLAGWLYLSPDGQRIPLDSEHVLQLRMPNPLDPYRGLGPVQSLLVDLDSARYTAEWNRNFFFNGAEPGGMLKLDKRLSDDEWAEQQERWRETHQGISNAHRVAILENGADWVDRKYTMRDMQFAELREVSREVIREAFGFPKPMLGATDDVNRANAEAGEYVFAKWLLIERLERWKGILNGQLLPLFGATTRDLEFDYENPVPEDVEQVARTLKDRSAAAKTLIDAGYHDADVLETVGLPAMRRAVLGTPPGARPAPLGPPPTTAPEEE